MTNSIVKGKAFERECAKLLTGLTGEKWHRVPSSGAMQTAQKIEDSRFKGDLFCEDEEYKNVCIECKITGKPITLNNMENIIGKWWEQAKAEAGDKLPVLMFSFSGADWVWMAYTHIEGNILYRNIIDERVLDLFIYEDNLEITKIKRQKKVSV
jgi:Holliday junction resolvase